MYLAKEGYRPSSQCCNKELHHLTQQHQVSTEIMMEIVHSLNALPIMSENILLHPSITLATGSLGITIHTFPLAILLFL